MTKVQQPHDVKEMKETYIRQYGNVGLDRYNENVAKAANAATTNDYNTETETPNAANADNMQEWENQKSLVMKSGVTPVEYKKTKLQYTIIDVTNIKEEEDLYNPDMFPIKSILPTRLIPKIVKFDTKFAGGDGVDHIEDESVKVQPASYLIKGPLGEVYQHNCAKFEARSGGTMWDVVDMISGLYTPKQDTRTVVEVTQEVLRTLNHETMIHASYGGTQAIALGDYLNVGDGEFYRIYGPAFDVTYERITNGGGKRNKQKKSANKKKAPPAVAKWVSQGRKVTTKKGDVRTLYRNSSTGELRVKRITERAGKRVTVYVKP